MKEASDFVKKRDVNYTKDMKQKNLLKPNKTFLKNTLRNIVFSNTCITERSNTRNSKTKKDEYNKKTPENLFKKNDELKSKKSKTVKEKKWKQ